MVSDMPDDWEFVSTDRDDDPFLFAAEAGNAKYIISLDKRHIISWGSFKKCNHKQCINTLKRWGTGPEREILEITEGKGRNLRHVVLIY